MIHAATGWPTLVSASRSRRDFKPMQACRCVPLFGILFLGDTKQPAAAAAGILGWQGWHPHTCRECSIYQASWDQELYLKQQFGAWADLAIMRHLLLPPPTTAVRQPG
ncbi:unnamed protein product, partial [Ectocarpus sp. 8 AP-2014]